MWFLVERKHLTGPFASFEAAAAERFEQGLNEHKIVLGAQVLTDGWVAAEKHMYRPGD